MKPPFSLVLISTIFTALAWAQTGNTSDWHDASLVKTSTSNEWCHHCPDWNQTSYFFKIEAGVIVVGRIHKTLDVTVNGHNKLRFDKDGRVGDYLHVMDDAGKDQHLKIVQRIAPETTR
jgi:hypothetical protein